MTVLAQIKKRIGTPLRAVPILACVLHVFKYLVIVKFVR